MSRASARERRLARQDLAVDNALELLEADHPRSEILRTLCEKHKYSQSHARALLRMAMRRRLEHEFGVSVDDPADVRLDGLARFAERRAELEALRAEVLKRCRVAGELPDAGRLAKLDRQIDAYTEKLGKWAWVHKIEPDRGLHDSDVRETVLSAMIENLEHFSPPELRRLADALAAHLGPDDEGLDDADLDDILPR